MPWHHYLPLALAALVVGVSKTSVSGFGSLGVALFSLSMPAKESTAGVLLLLIVGDVIATRHYRKDCDWGLVRTLLPAVLPGVALGAFFMSRVDSDVLMRRSIGAILLVLAVVQLSQRLLRAVRQESVPSRSHPLAAVAAGAGVGFTTMVANAAGPVMTLFLLAERVDKQRFISTNAWVFLMVNLSKIPFSAALGLFPMSTLVLTLCLAPLVVVGTRIGLPVARALSQRQFDAAALTASVLAALMLLVR